MVRVREAEGAKLFERAEKKRVRRDRDGETERAPGWMRLSWPMKTRLVLS